MSQLTLFEQKTRSFFNTLDLQGEDLKLADLSAKNQKEKIHHWFLRKVRIFGRSYKATTYQVHRETGMNLYSVRRAMSNLKDEGVLAKTEDRIVEEAGQSNFYFRLA